MITRVWGKVDGKDVPLHPVEGKPDYWYGYCDWSPNLLHMQLWCENDRGARGSFDGFIQIQYLDETHTKCRLLLYPYSVTVYRLNHSPFADAGRSRHVTESETFSCGEDRRVAIAVKSTDHHLFQVTNAKWELSNGWETEASGDCEVEAVRGDLSIIKAKVKPMRACCLYTLRFAYDVNDEHLIKDVTIRVE